MAASIKQRILRQLASDLGGITGVGAVHYWDARGSKDYNAGDIIIYCESDSLEEGPLGSPGYTDATLTLVIFEVVHLDETSLLSSSETVIAGQSQILAALHDNSSIIEDETEAPLAIDSRISMADGPSLEQGYIAAAVKMEVYYRHDRNSPYKYGSAIAEEEEEEGGGGGIGEGGEGGLEEGEPE